MIPAAETGNDRAYFAGPWYRDLLAGTECGRRIRSRMQARGGTQHAPPVAAL